MVDLEVDPGVQRNPFCSSYVGYWSDIRPERAIVAILQEHGTHLTTLEPPFQKSYIDLQKKATTTFMGCVGVVTCSYANCKVHKSLYTRSF